MSSHHFRTRNNPTVIESIAREIVSSLYLGKGRGYQADPRPPARLSSFALLLWMWKRDPPVVSFGQAPRQQVRVISPGGRLISLQLFLSLLSRLVNKGQPSLKSPPTPHPHTRPSLSLTPLPLPNPFLPDILYPPPLLPPPPGPQQSPSPSRVYMEVDNLCRMMFGCDSRHLYRSLLLFARVCWSSCQVMSSFLPRVFFLFFFPFLHFIFRHICWTTNVATGVVDSNINWSNIYLLEYDHTPLSLYGHA